MSAIPAHSIPVAMIGAITAYVGLYHLGLHLRRPRAADRFLAWSCLFVVFYNLGAFSAYCAAHPSTAAPWQRLQFAALCALCFSFTRLVAAALEVRLPRWFQVSLWAFFPLGILGLLERSAWVLSDASMSRAVNFPWGTAIYHEQVTGPLFGALFPLGACAVLYPLLLAHRGPLGRTDSVKAWALATVIPVAGLSHDLLCSSSILNSPYIGEYCWFAVLLMATWTLTSEVLDSARVRQTLLMTEKRFRTTLDAIQDAVITTDVAGTIAHLNPSAEGLLGVGLTEVSGAPLSHYMEISPAETGKVVADPVRFALARPPNPFGDLPQMVTTDGHERRVDIGGAPLTDERGAIFGAVVVVRDLTVQHEAIETLQHAKKMESMGRLASGVAHDLNNLLTPIVSYVELLAARAEQGSEEKVFLDHIQDAAGRATEVTRQLLALSRKQVLDVQIVSLTAFVQRSAPLVRQLIGEKIELVVIPEDAEGNVRIDQGQMEQVLLNLASNARDAMPKGGRLTMRVQDLTPQEVSLEVTDEGTGMAPEVTDRIFEPFFTTKPRGKGTGLGLASVRGIVEQHGGTIYVDSELGVGTCFEILLPRVEAAVAPSSQRRPVADTVRGGAEKILVVEDDPSVRGLLFDGLTGLGYTVFVADGLSQAEVVASSEQIDLLLTDVVMPEADGPLVLAAVQKYQDVPYLYMTGHADDRLGQRGFVEKGTVVLRKPFTVSQLGKRIRQVLDTQRVSPERPLPL